MVKLVEVIALWIGALVGILKCVDWLLSSHQKHQLSSWAAATWIWLDDQRLGKFISIVRNVRGQQILSLAAHTILLVLVLLFLGRVFLGWPGWVDIYIGTPRLHVFQVWIDVAAIFLSMILLSLALHPRITSWIARAISVPMYFFRTSVAAVSSYIALRLYISALIWAGLPLGQGVLDGHRFLGPAFFAPGTDANYGGRATVVLIHALTASIGAPLLTEAVLLILILAASTSWMFVILILSVVHIAIKFMVLRIAEHKDGQVLALSVLLLAIASILKIFG